MHSSWAFIFSILLLFITAPSFAEDDGGSEEPSSISASTPSSSDETPPEPTTKEEAAKTESATFDPIFCDDEGSYMPEKCKEHAEKSHPETVAKKDDKKEECFDEMGNSLPCEGSKVADETFDHTKCDDEGTYMPQKCKEHAEKSHPETVAKKDDKKEECFDEFGGSISCEGNKIAKKEECFDEMGNSFPCEGSKVAAVEEVFDHTKCDNEGTYMPEKCKEHAQKSHPETVAKKDENKQECFDEMGNSLPCDGYKTADGKTIPTGPAEKFDPAKCEFDGYETEQCRAHAVKLSQAADEANEKRRRAEAAARARAAQKAKEERERKASMDRWATDDSESRRMAARAPQSSTSTASRAPAAAAPATVAPSAAKKDEGVVGWIRGAASTAREHAGYMAGFAKEVVTGGEASQQIAANLRKTPKQLAEESDNAYTATVMGALARTGNLVDNTGKAAVTAGSAVKEHAGYMAGFAKEVVTGGSTGQTSPMSKKSNRLTTKRSSCSG
jgi:predicted small metal-binding protein